LNQPAPPPPPSALRARRRWIPVGEVVGVLALVVAALGLWDSHRERRQEDRDRAVADQRAAAQTPFVLRASASADGQRLTLTPVRDDQVIQSQTLVFPAKITAAQPRTTGDPRIEASWIADGLRHAAASAGRDKNEEDLRAPVGLVTSFLDNGQTRTDQSIYWIAYRLKPQLLMGAKVELRGLSLARRDVSGDLQAKVEALALPGDAGRPALRSRKS
jgi:hypothetical protein